MSEHAAKSNDIIDSTSATVARDLLSGLLQELRLMPDVWAKLPQMEQDDIINRVRNRVTANVRNAVHLIASNDRVTVAADLAKVTFGEKVQAVLNIGSRDPGRLDLAVHRGSACLIVIADASEHMDGIDEVKSEPDQRSIDGVDSAAGQIIEQAKRRSRGARRSDDDDTPPLNTTE